ncbi:glucose/quinate/shikimate family membrane-bound PQQ-dependent dehydrogenase [Aurantimonas sp. MSK8Z-1]|uniref:glucose/quinate/shikimate family membrane-bound PQQ-dependent dehydrogenase n=1 Tax=Mangrovibrevibacter kandeliae TaxID=2968473 RepID=UPI00211994AE|nr:glucose/quinate/shikimate family membrane-bound PQQ-dependent dehydrogenase [Aurantimonas sp. MSK8Z-1]MCW4115558.1 glucose/quinate/shikimate family membrane-bound PQQ-dependent dehydrogenase [Aurantimonas sp. MSK8Z-1]
MAEARNFPALWITGAVLGFIGLILGAGGLWLILLGGSWYYLVAGAVLILTAAMLIARRPEALSVYALLILGTLVWSIWESGFDWWRLAPRGDLLVIIGVWLITPFITRSLGAMDINAALDGVKVHPSATRGSGLALSFSLLVALLVAGVALVGDPTRVEGELPQARADVPDDAQGVPAADWHAYGRTDYGQRFSPLAQITADNVSQLEVAWHYETGDERGRPGDPVETTYEVTPLKIGDRLFLCTPHQNVIALDAVTGKEIWRFDPKIQGELALQHLTCRGLSYQPPGAANAGATATSAPPADAAAPTTPPAGEAPTAAQAAPAPQDATADPAQPQVAANGPEGTCDAKLFMPTADGRLIALDPDSGEACSNFGENGQINLWQNMPNVNPGSYYSTSPVVIAGNLVIVGGTVLDNVSVNEASGVIRAFDISTGALVWNWDSGNPDQTAPLPPGEHYVPNSPNSWSISALDPELGLVYVPLGNQPPDQWGGNRSDAVERYSSSVVALDVATGTVRWVFQTVHHDLWDYDVPSQPSLIDLTVNGERVPALVQPTKQGELYVLDRRNGQPVLPVNEVPAPQGAAQGDHTAPTQPVSALSYDPPKLTGADMWGATPFDQLYCRIAFHRMRYEGRYTPPTEQGSLIYPGNFGVFNWGSIAVDPERQVAFTTPTYLAFRSQLVPRQNPTDLYVQGGNRPQGSLPALNENFGAPFAVKLSAFTSPLGLPCQAPPWGYVAGADLTTGEIVWKHQNGTTRDASPIPLPFAMGVPNLGGPIMTAGNVAFLSGTIDYYVRAYDVTTGEQLWEDRLPAGGQATPMTYMGADGRQYLLVVAGGHGSLGTKAGDSVIAYALPKGAAPAQ